MAILQPLLERLEEEFPSVPGELVSSGEDGGRVLREANGGVDEDQAVPH